MQTQYERARVCRHTRPRKGITMNVVLWIVQVLVGVAFLIAGVNHAFRYEWAKAQFKWVADSPHGLVTFIGICEILGGIGLTLPALTGILPWLTPLAGAGLAL